MATLGSNNRFPKVIMVEGSPPTTPDTGTRKVYAKSDGVYEMDDTGTETGPFGAGGGGAHNADHEDGGSDELDVTGLAGELAAAQKVKDHTHAATGTGSNGGGATLSPTVLSPSGLVAFSGSIDSTVDANQNDYNPTGFHTSFGLRFTSFTAARTITGFDAGSGGELHLLINNTTQSLVLPNESASSSSANRFRCGNAANVTVRQSGSVLIVYSAGRWNVVAI